MTMTTQNLRSVASALIIAFLAFSMLAFPPLISPGYG